MKQYLMQHIDNHVTHASIGGALTGLFAAMDAPHAIGVVAYAIIGTVTSFLVSKLMAYIFKKKK